MSRVNAVNIRDVDKSREEALSGYITSWFTQNGNGIWIKLEIMIRKLDQRSVGFGGGQRTLREC
jgi:hypothetical protein